MAKTVGADSARVAILNDTDETVNKKDYVTEFGPTGIFKIDASTSEGLISAAISGLADLQQLFQCHNLPIGGKKSEPEANQA